MQLKSTIRCRSKIEDMKIDRFVVLPRITKSGLEDRRESDGAYLHVEGAPEPVIEDLPINGQENSTFRSVGVDESLTKKALIDLDAIELDVGAEGMTLDIHRGETWAPGARPGIRLACVQ